MIQTLRTISPLLVGYIFLFVGNSLLSTLVSLRAHDLEFQTTTIGLINAAYFLGLFVGASYSDWLVARCGHSRAYAVLASLGAVCALLHALILSPYAWFFIRLGTGVFVAGLMMVTECWLNSKATRTTRGQILSIYMITHTFASGSGQLLIPFAQVDTFHLFAIASIGYCLALVPVLITRQNVPELVKREKFRFMQVYRYSPAAMTGALCCGLVSSAMYGLAPVYTIGIGMTTATTALFMAFMIYGGGVLQWPVGKLSDRFDRRKLMVLMCLLSAVVCFAVIFSSSWGLVYFLTSAALFGAVSFTVYPIALAHMNDSIPQDKLLYASAGMLYFFSIGAVFGPVLAAIAIEIFGYQALFVYFTVVYCMYVALVLWRMKLKPAPERKRFRRFFRALSAKKVSHKNVQDEIDKEMVRMIGVKRR